MRQISDQEETRQIRWEEILRQINNWEETNQKGKVSRALVKVKCNSSDSNWE